MLYDVALSIRGWILGLGAICLDFYVWVSGFSGFSAILIAISLKVDRDHDEQIPRSGQRLIAIRLSVDRDQLGVFGDREQG